MRHYSRAGGTRQSRTKPGQFETEQVRVDPRSVVVLPPLQRIPTRNGMDSRESKIL